MPSYFPTKRARVNSLTTVPPQTTSSDYSTSLANFAAQILYKSPLPSQNDLPVYILNGAAFPDTKDVNYDELLPYVLARLPDEEQLIGGKGYEIVFFAGGEERTASAPRKGRPSWGWIVQAYQALSRTMRKRLQQLYLVHERRWVRVVSEMFSAIVSPKFRRKVVHVSSLTSLALYIPIEDLLIPPVVYAYDRKTSPSIYVPYATGRRAFGARVPLPTAGDGSTRLPRVLREATSFLLAPENVKTEGLFRVNARAATLDILKEAYDRAQKFIVWKEVDSVMTFDQWKEGFGSVTVDELELHAGYGLFAAAGLIKLWYSDMREPIFTESVYPYLERVFGNAAEPIQTSAIAKLISDNTEWSPITKQAQSVITKHLLPMLAAVASHPENKMTARNLAVCFAPGLLCGPDPLEDAKMSMVISRILDHAINQWDDGLSAECGINDEDFKELLKTPQAVRDWEDPLDSSLPATPAQDDQQTQGILLLDHDSSDSDEEENKPPLPPRLISNHIAESPPPPPPPRVASNDILEKSQTFNSTHAIHRRPAPELKQPPRYSTVFGSEVQSPDSLPVHELSINANNTIVARNDSGDLESPKRNSLHRKPLPSKAGDE